MSVNSCGRDLSAVKNEYMKAKSGNDVKAMNRLKSEAMEIMKASEQDRNMASETVKKNPTSNAMTERIIRNDDVDLLELSMNAKKAILEK